MKLRKKAKSKKSLAELANRLSPDVRSFIENKVKKLGREGTERLYRKDCLVCDYARLYAKYLDN